MTRQEFKAIDYLRLEVEVPPASGLVNLAPNPDGALGGWGWLTPAADSYMRGSAVDGLTFVNPSTANTVSWFTSEAMPVIPGQYAAAAWEILAVTTEASNYAVAFEWLNSLKQRIAYSAYDAGSSTDVLGENTLAPQLAPAGAAYCRLRFDLNSTSNGYVAPASEVRFTNVRVAVADTSAAVAHPMVFPDPWVNVLGPTHSITIDRAGLDVGTLDAEILDAALDPSTSSDLRPGRRVRCTVRQPDDSWAPIYTGKADRLDVEYDEKAHPPKPPRITLAAVDGVTSLASPRRSLGVGNIIELPLLLEGCGVPWNTNGSGDQVPSAVAVSTNDNASALDQVAITRDTRHGSAWVDRSGVLHVEDRAVLRPEPFPLGGTFDDPASVDQWGYVFGRAPLYATAAHETGVVHSGTGALRLTATSNAGLWNYMGVHTQSGVSGMPVVGGRTYTARMWTRAATTPRLARILVHPYQFNNLVQVPPAPLGTLNSTTEWTEHTFTFTASPDARFVSLTLMIEEEVGGSSIAEGEVHYIDDVSLELHRRNPLVIDEARYVDLDVTFSTEDLVNSVSVKRLRYDREGATEEVAYGPWEDEESVREWGRRAQTYTVHGLAEAELEDYAGVILARNGVPAARANSVVMPVRRGADLSTTALVDLFDEPSVRYAAKGIDQVLAVSRVRHEITSGWPDEKWLVEVGFAKQEGIAQPRHVPAVPVTLPDPQIISTSGTDPTITLGPGIILGGSGVNAARDGDVVDLSVYIITQTSGTTSSVVLTMPPGWGPQFPRYTDMTFLNASRARVYLKENGDLTIEGGFTPGEYLYGAIQYVRTLT